jgi:hypothetical protein
MGLRLEHLRVQPAGSFARLTWSMIALSVFPLTIGEMPKHLPSVGMYAVVRGMGLELQPRPEYMLRGMASRRFSSAGAALMPAAATRRVARVVNCMAVVV